MVPVSFSPHMFCPPLGEGEQMVTCDNWSNPLWQLDHPPCVIKLDRNFTTLGYELLVLVIVQHAPSLVFWAISCRFLSFVLPGLVVVVVFLFSLCFSWDVSMSLFGLFFSWRQPYLFPCLVRFQWHLAWDVSLDPDPAAVGTLHSLYVRFCTAAFGPQEPVIFENKTQGSQARLALEDSHRWGGLQLGTALVALAGTTWVKNTLDQLSQLMCAKVAVGPTVTLRQLVLNFGGTNVRF